MKCSEGYGVDISNICDGVKQFRISGNINIYDSQPLTIIHNQV